MEASANSDKMLEEPRRLLQKFSKEMADTTPLDQLNADSLDRLEAGMALEEEFGSRIPDEAIAKWSTVGDVLDWAHDDGSRRKTCAMADRRLLRASSEPNPPTPPVWPRPSSCPRCGNPDGVWQPHASP